MPLAPLVLIDPEERRSQTTALLAPSTYPLQLELPSHNSDRYWWKIAAASLLAHFLLLSFATRLPSFVAVRETPKQLAVHRMPLYFPRDALTQREPNKHEVKKQIDLADLTDSQRQQAQRAAPEPSVRRFEMPKTSAARQTAKAPVSILPDAPAMPMNTAPVSPLSGSPSGLAAAPTPPTASSGPFLNIGSEAPPAVHPTITPPKATAQSALSGLSQSGFGSHVIISDDSPTQAAPPVPGTLDQAGAQHAGVELRSDPLGIDMRPYLAQILSIVRGNWRRVIPQSARTGTMRGRTVLEFIINRDGSIPKLVTSESSGLDPLDRAAVAGLSMSNPLPPLPAGFKGEQVRLAFSFAYNMAAE